MTEAHRAAGTVFKFLPRKRVDMSIGKSRNGDTLLQDLSAEEQMP